MKQSNTLPSLTAMGLAIALSLTGLSLTTTAYAASDNEKGDSSEQQQSKLPVVDVLTVHPQQVIKTDNLPARLEASREAVIIPRISGIVEKRLFEEGSLVTAGEPLYQLDDGTYRAAVQTAKASLQQAIASRNLYRSTVNRYEPLVKANAVSRLTFDEAVANLKVQEANIAAAEAAIENAEINLGYATIRSPINGRVGISQVTEGAYVTASGTQMARVQEMDPMHVNITQSAIQLLNLRQAISKGKVLGSGTAEVRLTYDDGSEYPYPGELMFTDPTVDEETGEVTVRANVPNPNGELLPGLYMRVLIPQAVYPGAYLIPQQAITRGTAADTLRVVNKDGTFRSLNVTVDGSQGNDWVVIDGLQDGMQVIIDGTSKLQGATKVQTRPWKPEMEKALKEKNGASDASNKSGSSSNSTVGAQDLTQSKEHNQ